MKKLFLIIITIFITAFVEAQTSLATFEDGNSDQLSIENYTGYDASLFTKTPAIYDNPVKTGINKSAKCYGATYKADANWWGNFGELKLNTPVTITASNRYLSFMVYRSSQSYDMRVSFNTHDDAVATNLIWIGKLDVDGAWQKITVDLGTSFMGKTLNQLVLLFNLNWSGSTAAEASIYFDNITMSSVSIDASKTYQTIDNFGASDCFYSSYVANYWSTTQKEFITKRLFSQQFDSNGNPQGIGLSNWRVNVGGGSVYLGDASGVTDTETRTECFMKEDGTYDWTRCAGQQYFMDRAKSFGCADFTLFSTSIPYYFTKNGNVYTASGETCNLKDDKYSDFAEFLATVGQHYVDAGYHIRYISPLNEPQYDWSSGGGEGSPWPNANIAKIARQLNSSLQSRNSSIKILLGEAANWSCAYTTSTTRAYNQIPDLYDSSSSDYIGNLAWLEKAYTSHSYWTHATNSDISSYRTQAWSAASARGLKTYQTEWSLLGDPPSTDTGFPASYDAASYMDLALFMAKVIQSDLTFANVSSWSYWTALGAEKYSQKSRFYLIRLIPTSGDYGSLTEGGTSTPSKNLWVLGNYSLFIRPDYKRIDISGASDMNGLFGSSYISPDGTKVVSVYVNTATTESSINANFNGLSETGPSWVKMYLTDETHNLSYMSDASGRYTGAMVTIPARSVVTLVYTIGETVLDENVAYTNPTSSVATPLVTLNRTLKSTDWNTICLPFSMTSTQVYNTFGATTKVAHYTGFSNNSVDFSTSNVAINANEPCLIKPSTAASSYVVEDVSLSTASTPANTLSYNSGTETVSLIGTYSTIPNLYNVGGSSDAVYFLSGGKLYKADAESNVSMKGFRAYFVDSNSMNGAKPSISIDGVPTSIQNIDDASDDTIKTVYDISGRRMYGITSVKSLKKGIYIVNGRKLVVK
jgi:O-glycosyl hydrolase